MNLPPGKIAGIVKLLGFYKALRSLDVFLPGWKPGLYISQDG
jgi:hypothetical protein